MTSNPLQSRDGSAEPWSAGVGDCHACGAVLIGVPATARFCPRCGAPLPAEAAHPADADAAQRIVAICRAERALPPLPDATSDHRDGPPPLPLSFGDFHSDVLTAYASALFRLGWRYERGRGAHRNPAEAIRCYCKSARLGNVDAAARLATAPVPFAGPPPL